jgi:dipeptidyl aminopeptidase/acylaminoacyl peptidase
VAFTYAGDIWIAPASGGTATRLTAHPGIEVFAHFSPDGKWIAFTGQYDGDEQVYVVPANGGEPRQLTFYPARGPLTPRWGCRSPGRAARAAYVQSLELRPWLRSEAPVTALNFAPFGTGCPQTLVR